MIGSLDKVYKQVRLTGKLNVDDIYILEAIYKILIGCETSIDSYQRKILISSYNQILNSSKNICPPTILPQEQIQYKSKFLQAEYLDCNNYPNIDKIYYWQEIDYNTSNEDILDAAKLPNFTKNKPSDKYSVFEKGKSITYTNVGRIGFLAIDTVIEDIFNLYDVGGVNITDGFVIVFIPEINSTLISSINVYSNSVMNLKIIKT